MTLPPRLAFALKGAGCVLFAGHMAATCAPHVPVGSALQPVQQPFLHYQELTGIWQSWDMFTTIPYFHGYDVTLEVTEPDGKTHSEGVTLPGFAEYDHSVRAETFFMRVLGDRDFGLYLAGYAHRMCASLRDASGHGGQKLVFHESCERLRWLREMQENGVISNHEDHASQVFTCEG